MNNLQAWLTLHLTPQLGVVGCQRLLRVFGSPENILRASPRELLGVKGLKRAALTALSDSSLEPVVEREISRAASMGVTIVTRDDPAYPPLLQTIYNPPNLLYLRGNIDLLRREAVAVVGSRAATAYGVKVARKMAAELCAAGVAVVSGMALGVDTAAHSGALEGGGATVAVLGCGVDVVYPRQNSRLYEALCEHSLVVSEYPLGTRPEAFRFPARNRIISGLSRGVVVVEAAKRSGSLITARMALDEGREVFAVPGRIDSFKSAGTHHLLQEGAKLVNSVADILEELPGAGAFSPAGQQGQAEACVLSEEAKSLLAHLDVYPVCADILGERSGYSAAKISEIMLLLELKGLVSSGPGPQYSLTDKGRDAL